MNKFFTLKSTKKVLVSTSRLIEDYVYFDFQRFLHRPDGADVEYRYYYIEDGQEVRIKDTNVVRSLTQEEIEQLQSIITPSGQTFLEITLEFYIAGAFAVLDIDRNFGLTKDDWQLVEIEE